MMITQRNPKPPRAGSGKRVPISELLHGLDDSKVAAIEATGASIEVVEEAMAWASGESDVLGKVRHPLAGIVAEVYEILTSEEAFPEDH
jgi:hypothetical protein